MLDLQGYNLSETKQNLKEAIQRIILIVIAYLINNLGYKHLDNPLL